MDKKRIRTITWLAVLFAVVVVAVIGGRYIQNEYTTYHSPQVKNYEAMVLQKAPYEIRTAKKEVLGNTYMAFTVWESETDLLLYQCPDLFPVKGLESIDWDPDNYDIWVKQRDKDPVHLLFEMGWKS